jgi:hypothetical protein
VFEQVNTGALVETQQDTSLEKGLSIPEIVYEVAAK